MVVRGGNVADQRSILNSLYVTADSDAAIGTLSRLYWCNGITAGLGYL
jgi:hypothetical protein